MKKFRIKVLLALLICFQPIVASAAYNAWTGWYPVREVFTYSDGSFLMALNPGSAHANPAGCVSTSRLRVMPDQVNFDEMYQMALTAQAAGLKINAAVSGTSCAGNNVKVLYLRTLQP
jgi:hypothetical protein